MISNNLFSFFIITTGFLCFYRPMLLLYIFSTLPILTYLPVISRYDSTLHIFRIGSINIFAQDYFIIILATMLLGMLIYHIVSNKQFLQIVYSSPITNIIIILFTWEVFIGFLSYMKGFELQNILRRLSIDSLMFIAILMPFIKEIVLSKERFFKYIAMLSVFLVFVAFFRFSFTQEIELTSSVTRRTILGNTVVIFLFPLSYILFYMRSNAKFGFLHMIIVFLLLLGIIFTGHRSGYIAFLFLLGMWMSKNKFLNKELIWIPIWGFSLFLIILLIVPIYLKGVSNLKPGKTFMGDVVVRYLDIFDAQNKTTIERLSKWKYSLEIFSKAPMLGLARFPYYTTIGNDFDNTNLKVFSELNRAPHNIFANKIIHQGIIGLLLFIIFLFVIMMQFSRISNANMNYRLFLRSYVLSFILFSMFNTTFSNPVGLTYFSIVLGFLNVEVVKANNLSKQ